LLPQASFNDRIDKLPIDAFIAFTIIEIEFQTSLIPSTVRFLKKEESNKAKSKKKKKQKKRVASSVSLW
jgi:hypothetical protein